MDWHTSKRIDKILRVIQSTEYFSVANDRPPQFRVSSLPFCPLLFIAQNTAPKNVDQQPNVDYGMSFYTGIGTAIHTAMQESAKHSVNVIANWRCSRVLSSTNNGYSKQTTTCTQQINLCTWDKVKPKCPHKQENCKAHFEYSELEFNYKGLSGHLDFLIKIDGKYYILDFKTTSDWLFLEPAKAYASGYYPSRKYVEQIETYAALLEKQYNIKIDYYGIVYLARSQPTDARKLRHSIFLRKYTPAIRKQRMLTLKTAIMRHRLAQKAIAKPSKQTIQAVYDARPCPTRKAYFKEMKAAFFGSDNCPFHADRTCYSGELRKNLLKQLKAKQHE